MRATAAAVLATLALAAGLATLAPAGAQGTGTTWYVHGVTDPSGAGSYLDNAPPTADDADNTITPIESTGEPSYVFHSETADELPALALAGTEGRALVWLKNYAPQGAPTASGATTVDITVTAGGTAVATGSLTHDVNLGAIVEYDIPLTVTGSATAAGKLALDVAISNEQCSCYVGTAYPRGSSPDHPWQFTLPVTLAAPEPEVRHLAIDAPTVDLAVDAGSATTATTSYNWTTTLAAVSITISGNVTGGELGLSVRGPDGELLAGTYTGNVTEASQASPAAGNWTILVEQRAYVGTVRIAIGPLGGPGATPTTTTTPTPGATGTPGGTPTGSPTATPGATPVGGDEDEGSPMVAPALLAACLGAAAVLVRRRR